MTAKIPDTDSLTVAVMSAALQLADFPASSSGSAGEGQFRQKLERFVDAYDVIWSAIDQSPDAARTALEKIENRERT